MAFLFGLRTLLECLGKADKGREERDHSGQELHELGEIGQGHHLPSDGGLCPARGLPTARTILSERLTPARLLPSHRACAKKRAAKQRPSSESARYLGQSYSLKIMAVVELHCCRITYKSHPEGAIDEKQAIYPECTSGSSNIDALGLLLHIHESDRKSVV